MNLNNKIYPPMYSIFKQTNHYSSFKWEFHRIWKKNSHETIHWPHYSEFEKSNFIIQRALSSDVKNSNGEGIDLKRKYCDRWSCIIVRTYFRLTRKLLFSNFEEIGWENKIGVKVEELVMTAMVIVDELSIVGVECFYANLKNHFEF